MVGQGKFKRKLNLLDLTLIGVGSIIGSGWLFAAMISANFAGPAAWTAWLIGGAAMCLLALVYAELGSALPVTGGMIRYPQYSHGPLVGFMMSIVVLTASSTVAALEAEGMRAYASAWWPALGGTSPSVLGWIVQAILIIFMFLLNYWSVNVFGKANTVITLIKFVVPILAMIALFGHFHPVNFASHGFAPYGFKGIELSITTAGIAFAFQGYQVPVTYASEAKDPGRTLPLSILLSLVICAVFYMLLQIVFVGAVPSHLLSHGWSGLALQSPFANLAALLGLGWLANIILADAVLSPSGAGNVWFSATSRTFYAWAKNGTFFKSFSRVDEKTGVPRLGLWLSLILGLFWTLPFPSWGKLVGVISAAGVLAGIMQPVAVASFRRTAADLKRPFRLKGLAVIAPLAFIVSSLMVYWVGWDTISWLIGSQVVLFVLYILFRKSVPTHQVSFGQQLRSSWWMLAYYVAMLVLSYLGSFGGKSILPNPWDQILVAIVSIVAYYWAVASAVPKPVFDTDEAEAIEDAKLGNKGATFSV